MDENTNRPEGRRLTAVAGKAFFSIYFASATLTASPTFASEIVINDCDGVTRAQQEVASDSERFDLSVTLQGNTPLPEKVVLVSEQFSGEARVEDGKLTFSGLSEGVYELCDGDKITKVSQARLDKSSQLRMASTGTIALGAAALSGAALAIGGTNSGTSSNAPSSPAATNNLIGEAPSSAPATSSNSRAPGNSDRDCLNGAKVQPISPFE